jgi:ribonuclease BN (tRNA processing enzyme)
MKITFLGTSHGVPEADRYCSSTLISVGSSNYLIDAGGPVMDMLIRKGLNPVDITAIFVTHMHGDHTNGLPAFTDLISWYFKTAVPEIYLPDQRGVDALRLWNTVVHGREPRLLSYKVFEEGIIYNDGTLRVSAVKTQHTQLSYAFVLETEEKRVVFTGDLAGPDKDFPAVCFEKECTAIVCEAAHFPISKAVPVFNKCLAKRIFINHYVRNNIAGIEGLKTANPSYELTVVYDGFETEI